MDRTLSVREAARALSIGRTKLYQLLDANELGSLKIGNRRLIPASDIDAFISRGLSEGRAK